MQQPSHPSQTSLQLSWELLAAFLVGAVASSVVTAVGIQGSLFAGVVTP